MKKAIRPLLLFLLLAVSGCGRNDCDIRGRWAFRSASGDDLHLAFSGSREEGTLAIVGHEDSASGTYSVTGSTIVFALLPRPGWAGFPVHKFRGEFASRDRITGTMERANIYPTDPPGDWIIEQVEATRY
jgi:hypothetical protein